MLPHGTESSVPRLTSSESAQPARKHVLKVTQCPRGPCALCQPGPSLPTCMVGHDVERWQLQSCAQSSWQHAQPCRAASAQSTGACKVGKAHLRLSCRASKADFLAAARAALAFSSVASLSSTSCHSSCRVRHCCSAEDCGDSRCSCLLIQCSAESDIICVLMLDSGRALTRCSSSVPKYTPNHTGAQDGQHCVAVPSSGNSKPAMLEKCPPDNTHSGPQATSQSPSNTHITSTTGAGSPGCP